MLLLWAHSRFENLELELSYGAQPCILTPDFGSIKELNDSLETQLRKAVIELLSLEWVFEHGATEEFGGETRDSRESNGRHRSHGVANAEFAGVIEADDVTGPRLLHNRAFLRHEAVWFGQP